MKRLILMRHAKADDQFSGSDMSRPLTKEGVRIQKQVSKYMKEKPLAVDGILFSPFKRAEESAKIIAENYPKAKLEKEAALGTVFDSFTILKHLEEKAFKSALIVGHAPTLAIFALSLLKEPQHIEFDKSGIAILDFKNEVGFGKGDLILTLSPKELV